MGWNPAIAGTATKGRCERLAGSGRDRSRAAALLYTVEEWQPTVEEIPEEASATKVTIEITPEEHLVTDQAVQALAARAALYVRDCELVRILTHDGDEPTTDGITRPTALARIRSAKGVLRDTLTGLIRFVRERHKGDETYLQDCHPPQWCIDSVAIARSGCRYPSPARNRDLPRQCVPTGRYYGNRGTTRSELFLDYRGRRLSTRQSDSRRRPEGGALLLELMRSFPFASDRARACWMACVLSPFARNAYNGPTPCS